MHSLVMKDNEDDDFMIVNERHITDDTSTIRGRLPFADRTWNYLQKAD